MREIENFSRDTRSLLAACEAFYTFDRSAADERTDYVPRLTMYNDLLSWFDERTLSYVWRLMQNKEFTPAERQNEQELTQRFIYHRYANDECVNYLMERSVHNSHVERIVRVASTFILTIIVKSSVTLLQQDDHWEAGKDITPERLDIESKFERGSEKATCLFDALDCCEVLQIPLHSPYSKHWSLLVFYRLNVGQSLWYAVHYDTLAQLNGWLAKDCYRNFCWLVTEFIDASIIFRDEVYLEERMFVQNDGWSCGYRIGALAKYIVRVADAYDLQMGDKSDEEVNRLRVEGDAIEKRVQTAIQHRNFRKYIDDAACAVLLSEALDDVRSHELVECVRLRCVNI